MATIPATLITGGTGKTGRRVAARLQERGVPVRVGARRTPTPLDYDEEGTWPAALAEVDAVYLTYAPDLGFPGAAATLGAFARFAAERGVARAVMLSGRGEPGTHPAEDAVRDAIPATTVVRASWFAQNLSEHFLLGNVLAGDIALPGQDVGEPFVDVRDIADIAVEALTTRAFAGATLEVTGPRLVRFGEVAERLTAALGRPVRYRTVTAEEYREGAVATGVDPHEADALAQLFSFIFDGHNATTTDTVSRVLGRPARDIADYILETAATGVWTTHEAVVA